MASTDARPIPIKNTAYRVYFPILDADGDLVTGASGLDSEVSKDGAAFADCTNEATEIGSSGMYYLDLTNTEMNADCVVIIAKTSTTGAKTTPIVLYPQESGDIKVDVQSYGGTAGTFSGGRPEVNTTHAAGTAWGSGAITAASIATDAITAAKIAADAIGASELAADAVAEIQSGLMLASSYTAPLSADGTRTAMGMASANLDTQLGLLATAASLATVAGYVDTEVAAIKTQTDKMAFTVANQLDVNVLGWKSATAPAMTGDAFARLGAPAGASVSADIAAINSKTTNLPSDPADQSLIIDATNAILTAVGDVPTNAELATALAGADDAVLAAIAALNNLSAADVNAQVLDVLSVDTFAQPAQGNPPATATLVYQIGLLYKALRNRVTQTSSEFAIYADDATTKDQKATVSDDGTTFSRGELGTGA